MKRLFAASALLIAPLCAPIGVHAQEALSGPYVSLGGGVNMPGSETLKSTTSPGFDAMTLTLNDGAALEGSLGWGFGNGIRAEIEGDYANSRFSNSSFLDFPGSTTSQPGRQEQYGFLVNLLYDFNLGLPVVPYIGAGLGYQAVNFNSAFPDAVSGNYNETITSGGMAYQGIGGLSLPLNFVIPGLALTAEYRYLGVSNLNGSIPLGSQAGYDAYANGGPKPAAKIDHISNNEALIGLRYSLGEWLQ